MKRFKGLNVRASSEYALDIEIFGDVVDTDAKRESYEDITPSMFRDFLEYADNRVINMYINSPGGSVTAGLSIYNMIKAYPGKVNAHVDFAGSISSIIAFAADEIFMATNSKLMIHRAWAPFVGNVIEFQKALDYLNDLDNQFVEIYLSKALQGITKETILDYMDKETWFDGNAAQQVFNVTVHGVTQAYARLKDVTKYKNIPEDVKNTVLEQQKKEKEMADKKLQLARAKALLKLKLKLEEIND